MPWLGWVFSPDKPRDMYHAPRLSFVTPCSGRQKLDPRHLRGRSLLRLTAAAPTCMSQIQSTSECWRGTLTLMAKFPQLFNKQWIQCGNEGNVDAVQSVVSFDWWFHIFEDFRASLRNALVSTWVRVRSRSRGVIAQRSAIQSVNGYTMGVSTRKSHWSWSVCVTVTSQLRSCRSCNPLQCNCLSSCFVLLPSLAHYTDSP